MIINGKKLSEDIIIQLQKKIDVLKKKSIFPKIVIITIGSESTWKAYVGQKIKMAEKLEVERELIHLKNPTERKLIELIEQLNQDKTVHGIIIQRPFNNRLNKEKIVQAVLPIKDIDGFSKDSPYQPPLWEAIEHILAFIAEQKHKTDLYEWLKSRSIVIIGKGDAGGKLIREGLGKKSIKPSIVDSKTKNKNEILLNADIIISAAGKPRVVQERFIKQGVVLISIGMSRAAEGKLQGDYDEDEVDSKAEFYTPVPGGVGPLNVAFLFKNLIDAASRQ